MGSLAPANAVVLLGAASSRLAQALCTACTHASATASLCPGAGAGIAEDPVTGSAHSVLGPYWAARLPPGRPQLRARQCSRRGGELLVEVRAEEGRVVVSGQAVMTFKGHLLLPAASCGTVEA